MAIVEFGRMFLTYGLLLLIVVVVSALAIFLGITFAKKKNAKTDQNDATVKNE